MLSGPGVVRRGIHELRADRIELDVAAAGEKIAFGIDQRGAETAFEQAAGALVLVVEPGDVEAAHLLHHQGQARIVRRRRQQVQVVRHQDISVDRHFVEAGRFLQPDQEALVVGLFAEDRLTVIATLDDVVGLVRDDESGKACHGICSNDEQAFYLKI